MKNERDMLYEINIEKAKALFEYEMTSVLLAEKEADEAAKERIRQYMEMEIDKPEVSYTAPEQAPAEIDPGLVTEAAAMPDFSLPQITAEADGLPIVAKTHPFVSPEFSKDTDIRSKVTLSEPVDPASYGFSAEGLFSFSEKNEAAPLNKEDMLDADMFEAGLKGLKLQTDIKPLSDVAQGISISGPVDIPERVNTKIVFSPAEYTPPKADVKIPSTTETGFDFKKPDAEVSVGEIKLPGNQEIPEFNIITGFKPEKSLSEEAADIKVPEPGKWGFTLPPAKKAEVSVDYRPAVPVSFEVVKPAERKISAPEYPDVPDAPDISAYVDDIMETLRSDMS